MVPGSKPNSGCQRGANHLGKLVFSIILAISAVAGKAN
jgi:hypothetical protein